MTKRIYVERNQEFYSSFLLIEFQLKMRMKRTIQTVHKSMPHLNASKSIIGNFGFTMLHNFGQYWFSIDQSTTSRRAARVPRFQIILDRSRPRCSVPRISSQLGLFLRGYAPPAILLTPTLPWIYIHREHKVR